MAANAAENQYSISFHDSAWIPILSSENVLDYFCQRTNQFYDRTCNNEVIKMQRLDPGQLQFMTGIEYVLIHAQDPILYVIRKQMRYSPTQVSSLAVYYILAGVVYQAPDLGTLINSRLLSFVHKLDAAFSEVLSYSHYTPAKGYSWQFSGNFGEALVKKKRKKQVPETSSLFQRQRIDILLRGFVEKYPPKAVGELGHSSEQKLPKEPSSPVKSEVIGTAQILADQVVKDGRVVTEDSASIQHAKDSVILESVDHTKSIAQIIAAEASGLSMVPEKKRKKDS